MYKRNWQREAREWEEELVLRSGRESASLIDPYLVIPDDVILPVAINKFLVVCREYGIPGARFNCKEILKGTKT